MTRIVSSFAALAAILLASCGDAEDIAATKSAPVTSTCNAAHPARTVDVTLVDGTCTRYAIPPSPVTAIYSVVPPASVSRLDTGPVSGAWACNGASPAGAPGQPCWTSGSNNLFRRSRGPLVSGQYQVGGRDIATDIVAHSVVMTLGSLYGPAPGIPTCPYSLGIGPHPINWHACGTLSDAGLPNFTANSDPTDATTCCQVTARWPSGDSGSPCLVNDAPGVGYATVHYQCPTY